MKKSEGIDIDLPLDSVDISATKYIIPGTDSFTTKLICHEEKEMPLADRPPNFTNHMDSTVEARNEYFTFKEDTGQPDRL